MCGSGGDRLRYVVDGYGGEARDRVTQQLASQSRYRLVSVPIPSGKAAPSRRPLHFSVSLKCTATPLACNS